MQGYKADNQQFFSQDYSNGKFVDRIFCSRINNYIPHMHIIHYELILAIATCSSGPTVRDQLLTVDSSHAIPTT